MRLEQLKDMSLDKYVPENAQGQDEALSEAMDLLYNILNKSYQCSGTCLEAKYNGHRTDIQGLYWTCKELLTQASQNPEKTSFLAMSVLEQAWRQARPLLLCPLDKMLDGDLSMLEDARRLEFLLSDNIYKKAWEDKSIAYINLLKRAGFDPDPGTFKDLTKIMDPLLNALTFYCGDGRHVKPRVYKVRDGAISNNKNPAIAVSIKIYRSEKELIDAAMAASHESLVAFGAIEKTHAQVKDYFTEWYHGYPEERQRNMMKHEGLTEEQYLAMPADYTRAVNLCVRSGQCCWLVEMPYRSDSYSPPAGDKDSEYYYGKRASYAPYQVFYKESAPAPGDSTKPKTKQDGYLLSEIMDQLSTAWYPAFLDETIKLFFGDKQPESIDLVLSEETAAAVPGNMPKNKYDIVPVFSGAPDVCSKLFEIKEPEQVFKADDDENVLYLLKYFNITPDSIKTAPLIPESNGTAGALQESFGRRLRLAYLKALAVKAADLNESRWGAREFMVEAINTNMPGIIKAAGDGDFMAFMQVRVDGQPVLDKNGDPVMKKSTRWPFDDIPEKTTTSAEDGVAIHVNNNPCHDFNKIVYWLTSHSSNRPPVVWQIRPKTAGDYAALAGCKAKDLPEILKLSGYLSDFYNKYKPTLPQELTCQYPVLGYGRADNKKSAYIPCFGAVNICMNKKAFKSFGHFRK